MNTRKLCFNVEKIYGCGDIHGGFSSVLTNINNNAMKDTLFIVCGDVGIGFEPKTYYDETFEKLNKELVKSNVHLVLFRGNHDDPKYFDGKHWVEEKYSNIYVVPDYTILDINQGKRCILCIGGATSVDRLYRLQWNNYARLHKESGVYEGEFVPQCYWEGEKPVFNRNRLLPLAEQGFLIDTVCAHTTISSSFPYEKGKLVEACSKKDPWLIADIEEDRTKMDKVFNLLKEKGHPLRQWVYGHFHQHNDEVKDGVRFLLLNEISNGKLDYEQI